MAFTIFVVVNTKPADQFSLFDKKEKEIAHFTNLESAQTAIEKMEIGTGRIDELPVFSTFEEFNAHIEAEKAMGELDNKQEEYFSTNKS